LTRFVRTEEYSEIVDAHTMQRLKETFQELERDSDSDRDIKEDKRR
jgi:hypothetical protein